MKRKSALATLAIFIYVLAGAQTINITSLVTEMADRSRLAKFPQQAAKPIISLKEIDDLAVTIKKDQNAVPGAIETQNIRIKFSSDKMKAVEEKPAEGADARNWNRGNHLLITAANAGESVSFTVTEQFRPAAIKLQVTKKPSYAIVQFYVNGRKVGEPVDLSGTEKLTTALVELGVHKSFKSEMLIKMEFIGKNSSSKSNSFDAAIDYVKIIAE